MDYPITNTHSNYFGKLFSLSLVVLIFSMSACYNDNEEALYPVRPGSNSCDTANMTFDSINQPIFQSNCATSGCHAGVFPAASLDLTTLDNVKQAVNQRHLLNHVRANGYSLMPPSGSLSECNINKLDAWIKRGMPK
jgi:cytochrome c5